jgi:hypothetical protein
VHYRQVVEICPVVVVQASAPFDRPLHVELGRAHQLDSGGHVVHGLVPELHDSREGLGIFMGVALDGALALASYRFVPGIRITRGCNVDDGQQSQSNAEEDQKTRLCIVEQQRSTGQAVQQLGHLNAARALHEQVTEVADCEIQS